MTTTHRQHEVDAIDDAGEKALQEINNFMKTLDTDVFQKLVEDRKGIEKSIEVCDYFEENCRRTFRERINFLMKELKEMEASKGSEITEVFRRERARMGALLHEVKQKQTSALGVLSRCQEYRDHGTYKELIQFQYPPLDTMKPPINMCTKEELVFKEAHYKFPSTDELIGSIQKVNIQDRSQSKNSATPSVGEIKENDQQFDPQIIEIETMFDTTESPANIFQTRNGDICSRFDSRIYLYGDNGQHKHTIKAEAILCDIILTPTDDIIAIDYQNERVVEVLYSGNLISLCSTAPMKPTSICINNRNQLVIGQNDGCNRPRNKLVVYSSDTKSAMYEIENDIKGKPLFNKYIRRVKQNGIGDYIVLVDRVQVLCVREASVCKWRYEGEFMSDVVCDRYNNVIVCDCGTVFLLGQDGKRLCTLLVRQNHYGNLISLCTDTNGRLFVGHEDCRITIARYLR